jgi:precorrin-3B methylase
MMTIAEAILNANQIYVAGWEAQQRQFQAHPAAAYRALQEANQNLRLREYVHRLSSHRSGKVMVTRVLDRSIGTCPYCGASFNAGHFLVRHQDGRELRFDVALAHYAKMGHVISSEDIDIYAMIAIMEDA